MVLVEERASFGSVVRVCRQNADKECNLNQLISVPSEIDRRIVSEA